MFGRIGYNGAQVTGVEKREVKIPIEIQKQAVDLDEKVLLGWGGCTGGGHRRLGRGSGSSMSWAG